MVRGVVHDENAYALGGVAGHAGLFSTAGDLAIFAQMLLNGGVYDGVRIVSDSTVRLFTTRSAGSRALGWAMADGQWGSGRYLSDGSFGHVGFTGTSIWIDPERELFVILLTNRVYKPKVRGSSKVIADVRADLADAAAVAVTDDPERMLAMPDAFRSDTRHGWNPRPARRHHTAPPREHRERQEAGEEAGGEDHRRRDHRPMTAPEVLPAGGRCHRGPGPGRAPAREGPGAQPQRDRPRSRLRDRRRRRRRHDRHEPHLARLPVGPRDHDGRRGGRALASRG